MDTTVQLEGPYNFDQSLKRLAFDPLNSLDREKRTLKMPILIKGKPVVVTLRATGTTEKPTFHLTADANGDKDAILTRVYEIMHFDVPLKRMTGHYENTDLYPLMKQSEGVPFITDFQLYGCLMKTIIHQQLNMAFATTLTERFVKTYGTQKEGAWFYPDPETVSGLDVQQLRELQFSGRKAEYVIQTSEKIAAGHLDLDGLRPESEERIVEKLTALRGIGRWTSENFMMFGLGRMDLFPAQDIGVQNALKQFYHLDQKPSLDWMEKKSADWKPYRSYVTLYLWNSLENGIV
ncbi:DNA-3-methyladenine glycosylase 2 family protein [Bacillus sp. H-16]|uniref:DNA-3-methyladenine glycosylase family protein n=1 Tax=Alteribacter salitolerans TaxID=2912333 RepID=UPI001966977B|nr:DNA-3-methyladenine glycosylase [Alteribacter salitolerans]MBM7097724.1 DNA-3-methyladenine glycosylase 2 family protein [Alteribacter salitolerans]